MSGYTFNLSPAAPLARQSSGPARRRNDYYSSIANLQNVVVSVESKAADLGNDIISAFHQVAELMLQFENDPAWGTDIVLHQTHEELTNLNRRLDALADYIRNAVIQGESY